MEFRENNFSSLFNLPCSRQRTNYNMSDSWPICSRFNRATRAAIELAPRVHHRDATVATKLRGSVYSIDFFSRTDATGNSVESSPTIAYVNCFPIDCSRNSIITVCPRSECLSRCTRDRSLPLFRSLIDHNSLFILFFFFFLYNLRKTEFHGTFSLVY